MGVGKGVEGLQDQRVGADLMGDRAERGIEGMCLGIDGERGPPDEAALAPPGLGGDRLDQRAAGARTPRLRPDIEVGEIDAFGGEGRLVGVGEEGIADRAALALGDQNAELRRLAEAVTADRRLVEVADRVVLMRPQRGHQECQRGRVLDRRRADDDASAHAAREIQPPPSTRSPR